MWSSDSLNKQIMATSEYLIGQGVVAPDVGIILGSGLNSYAETIANSINIPYAQIPGFYEPKAPGHVGKLVYGDVSGIKVVAMVGRFHFYEGYSMTEVTLPTRAMIDLGIRRLIITNAAGCINQEWQVGDLMLIRDHINLSSDNPLIGPNLSNYGERFPDMSHTYSEELRDKLKDLARAELGLELREGVYTMMSGPSFETPAEVNFLRIIGADAVGMSSVPEAIIASQAKIEIVGISLMANMAAGIGQETALSSDAVNATGETAIKQFGQIVNLAIRI